MTTSRSLPFSLSVASAASTLLAKTIAGTGGGYSTPMGASSWRQFTALDATNQDAVLRDAGGNTGSKLPYCNSMPWNPIAQRIEVIGQDHGTASQGNQLKRYYVGSNQWELTGQLDGFGAHGYDHAAVDPQTGHLYAVPYQGGASPLQCWRLGVNDPLPPARLPDVYPAGIEYRGVAIGACWWSGELEIANAGPAGNFFVFASEGSSTVYHDRGAVSIYNPASAAWFYNSGTDRAPGSVSGPGCGYHSVAEYSRLKNVAVYGGGNGNETRLWRFDKSAGVKAMPTAPVPIGANEAGQGRICEEPTTGTFLVLYDSQLWELNPDGDGAWTRLTDSAPVTGPMSTVVGAGRCFLTAIAEYGVVVLVTQPASSGGTIWIYKR